MGDRINFCDDSRLIIYRCSSEVRERGSLVCEFAETHQTTIRFFLRLALAASGLRCPMVLPGAKIPGQGRIRIRYSGTVSLASLSVSRAHWPAPGEPLALSSCGVVLWRGDVSTEAMQTSV